MGQLNVEIDGVATMSSSKQVLLARWEFRWRGGALLKLRHLLILNDAHNVDADGTRNKRNELLLLLVLLQRCDVAR